MKKPFLARGNGYQTGNRRTALSFVEANLAGVTRLDERTVSFPPYGACHFAAYADPDGAMISTPGRDDNAFGSADWRVRDTIMMFHHFADGRCAVFVRPTRPLFDKRTIGRHRIRWDDVRKVATFIKVFPGGLAIRRTEAPLFSC